MNKVILIGRNTKDIELRTTPSGLDVIQFTLAVQRNYKNSDGEYDADFINCIAFKNTAKTIHQYIKKGHKLAVEGRIQNRSYDSQDGTKRYVIEVIVDNIEFLEKRESQNNESTETDIQNMSNSQIVRKVVEEDNDPFTDFANEIELSDDDLPF